MGEGLTGSQIAVRALGVIGTALVLRAIKRSVSPEIRCKLKCKCGKVEGCVKAKKEDSIRIHCFCEDCRVYARFVAAQGNHEEETIGKNGDNRVVQVCKQAVTIEKGQEFLQLARKGPPSKDNKQLFMHRFYASCCGSPLFNTVDFLGFVGVFTDFLDENHTKFDGPVCMFPEKALNKPDPPIKDIFAPDFLWKLVRYFPWRNSGPFDYGMEPKYWGSETKKTS